MDYQAFIDQVTKHITPEQIDAILDDFINSEPHPKYCVCCGEEYVPVDAAGDVILEDEDEDEDEETEIDAWHQLHTDDCPIKLLAKALNYAHPLQA